MSSIFLSHSHTDKEFVQRLSRRLSRDEIRTWVDEAEMHVGDSLLDKIEGAIRESAYVGAILSPDSVKSKWVRIELNIALTEEINGSRVKVLPLLHKPCEIPGRIADKLYADFTEDFEIGYTALLARLTSEAYSERHGVNEEAEWWQQQLERRAKRMQDILEGSSVLVVNDFPETMHSTIEPLQNYGVRIKTATTTNEAIALMTDNHYDVVISDMRRGGIPDEGQRFLHRTIRLGIDRPTVYAVYQFEHERGVPAFAFGIAGNHYEIVHLTFDALERERG